MRYAGFFVMLFLSGENLSFFATADDIDDGDLTIFEGGVENNGDEFLIVDEVPDKVDVVVTAVDIDDGLEASILDISRFGDMFAFIDAIVVLRDLPSVFVDGEEVLRADAVCGMFSDDDDGSGDYNGVSGGGVVVSKKKVSFSRGDNCLLQFRENSNSTAITELTTAGVRRNITIDNSYVCDSKIWIQIFDRRKKTSPTRQHSPTTKIDSQIT